MKITLVDTVSLHGVEQDVYVKDGSEVRGFWKSMYGDRDMGNYKVEVNGAFATGWKDLKDGDVVTVEGK